MASISSPGVGAGGLDVKSIIAQLVALEKKPLAALRFQQQAVDSKISAWGQIKSLVATLSDAAGQLASVAGWNAVSASSSDPQAVSASAAGGARPTSFVVEVQGLARAQATASAPLLPPGAAVGAGLLRIETGRWSGTTFAAAAGAAQHIAVGAGDTLADIASKINGAGAGVSASLLSDSAGERLLLRANDTGSAAGFRLSALEGPQRNPDGRTNRAAAGLSRLVSGASVTQTAADARATVNGIAVSSASNCFATTVSGLSFTAARLTSAPVEITVRRDEAAIKSRVDDFVKAWNAVNQQLQEVTRYDAQTRSAGLLQGDASAIALQNALRRALGAASSGAGAYRTLSDAGLAQQLGGDLALDAARFSRALAEHPQELKNLFRNPDSGSAQGLALRLKTLTSSLLAGNGLFQATSDTLQLRLARNRQEQARANDKLAAFEQQLTRRYNALDKQLSSLDALGAYVRQQLTVWNKSER